MEHRFVAGKAVVLLKRGNIAEQGTDAIANAANSLLLGGGGVDGAIHKAAGPKLLEACRAVKKTLDGGVLATGQAVITPGFNLRAQHVIHCVGPIYARDGDEAPGLLASCYENALRICRTNHLRSITFPSISTGVYGYPVDRAAPVALRAVHEALGTDGQPELVVFSLFDEPTMSAYLEAARLVFS